MKVILQCPRCRKQVAVDRNDQLPLPAPTPPPPPDREKIYLQRELDRMRQRDRDQRDNIQKLTSENEGLRSNMFDRHATPAEKWMLLAKTRQTAINRLMTENRELKNTLTAIKPQAAAKFFEATASSEGYLVINGSTTAFPDVQY